MHIKGYFRPGFKIYTGSKKYTFGKYFQFRILQKQFPKDLKDSDLNYRRKSGRSCYGKIGINVNRMVKIAEP